MNNEQGSLVCVGIGMKLGAHLSPIAKSHIEQADIVFCLASDGLVEMWIKEMSAKFISLQPYYKLNKERDLCYHAMVDAIVDSATNGNKVVGAFYGHPGVFACVPHLAIEECRSLGLKAYMEPGISSEDCLYADLGIDPGTYGCLQFEASQFMFYQRHLDLSAYLILWQIAIAGDTTLSKYSTDTRHRRVLIELLQQHGYNLKHQVILYESPTLAIHKPRIDKIPLSELVNSELNQQTTLVVPPFEKLLRNESVLSRLDAMTNEEVNLRLVN